MTDEERKHQEFVNAAAAVYAWVSAADGNITKSEINGFVEYLGALEYVDEISDADFSESYLNLLEVFENNFEEGLARAQTRIEPFSGDQERSTDLITVARRALIADDSYNESEEQALKEISKLLNIDESEVK